MLVVGDALPYKALTKRLYATNRQNTLAIAYSQLQAKGRASYRPPFTRHAFPRSIREALIRFSSGD